MQIAVRHYSEEAVAGMIQRGEITLEYAIEHGYVLPERYRTELKRKNPDSIESESKTKSDIIHKKKRGLGEILSEIFMSLGKSLGKAYDPEEVKRLQALANYRRNPGNRFRR